jgi:uncharacterized membrane protein YfcA
MRIVLIISGMLLFSFLGYFLKIYDLKSSIVVFISVIVGSLAAHYLFKKRQRKN